MTNEVVTKDSQEIIEFVPSGTMAYPVKQKSHLPLYAAIFGAIVVVSAYAEYRIEKIPVMTVKETVVQAPATSREIACGRLYDQLNTAVKQPDFRLNDGRNVKVAQDAIVFLGCERGTQPPLQK